MTTHHRIPVDGEETVDAVAHTAESDEWLVCCHGFVSDKSGSYESRCLRAVDEGYNAVRFDFRGCGDSSGEFVDQTLGSRLDDLRAVLDYFERDTYVVFGSSFGAKVAFHAAVADDRIRAVAGRAPVTDNRAFDDVRAVVEREGVYRYDTGQTIDRRFFDDLDRYPFDRVTATLDIPVALFHGGADQHVPLSDSLDAAADFETSVLLQTFPTEGHRFSESAETRLRRQLFDWLALDDVDLSPSGA
jgi:pimeloyl-ACP methyl ester carboxylesterase